MEMTEDFWHTMFLSVDYNGDGVLDVDEFKDLVQIVTDGCVPSSLSATPIRGPRVWSPRFAGNWSYAVEIIPSA